MVDNENQWEDVEYSEEQGDEETYSYSDDSMEDEMEYSDQTEDGDYEYEDYEEDDDAPAEKKSNSPLLILLFLILLGVAGFIAVPKITANKQAAEQNTQSSSVQFQQESAFEADQAQQSSQSSEELANAFFEEASSDGTENMMSVNFNEQGETNVTTGEGENAQVATVSEIENSEVATASDLFEAPLTEEEVATEENNSIMVVYNKASRLNPFKPPVVDKDDEVPFETIDNNQFEIIEPPVTSVPDENLTRLLQTQISGILFDEESPSAIVNLNGMDQFVKVGDVVSGYKIEDITRDKVQISYKSNSYVASVGELFTRGSLEKRPAVANLENKFAGRYKNQEQ